MAKLSAGAYEASYGPALLRSVAEELKLPLMHIARGAELTRLQGSNAEQKLKELETIAGDTLTLIDSYVLGLELAERQQLLELEPVSVAAVLYDTAHGLHNVAKQYNVEIELRLGGAYGPAMANRSGLYAALLSLGNVFIEAQPLAPTTKKIVTMAAYKAKNGLAVGVYSQAPAISPAELKLACRLHSRARQPLGQFSAGGAAGVFVANSILQAMTARLRTSHYHKQAGLGTVLLPSRQLQLV